MLTFYRPTSGPRRASARMLAGLVLALLLAQALGLMHRITHAPGAGTSVVSMSPGALAHVHDREPELRLAEQQGATFPADPAPRHDWLAAMFDQHGDEAGCRLFDLLNHQGVASQAPMPLLAQAFFAPPQSADATSVVVRVDGFFQARAPPLIG